MKKICNNCELEKTVDFFYKRKDRGEGSAGYLHVCKDCFRSYRKSKRNEEIDDEKTSNKSVYSKEYNKEYMKTYRETNREKLNDYNKKYQSENSEELIEKRKKYYKENKETISKRNYEYCKSRKKSDPIYKLTLNIKSLILLSLKSKFTEKSKKTIEILGCSFEDFSKYLESKFDENMNWENQGSYWHIDHIKPISLAETEEEVYELNHYTNFQPLYWRDNLIKGNRF